MFSRHLRPRRLIVLSVATAATGLLAPTAASGTTGPQGGADHHFTTRILIGDTDPARGCSGALVSSEWAITTASCFANDPSEVTAGRPAVKSTLIVSGSDFSSSKAHTSTIAELVPAKGRDIVMARLADSAPASIPTVSLSSIPLATGDETVFAGTGRTATEWAPDKVHTAVFNVGGVDDATLTITGQTMTDAICQGDAGGPLLRHTADGAELVGLATGSWQGGCLGTHETETRTDARAVRTDDLGDWISSVAGRAWTRQLAAGDFDGDKKADAIAIDETDGNLYLHAGDGKGGFAGRRQLGVQWETSRVITAGNFAGDSNTDLVAIRDNGLLLTYTGNGNGNFAKPITAGTGWNSMRLLAAGDFDGDKKTDLLAAHTNGTLYIYPGTGDGKVGRGIVAGTGWAGIRLIAGGDFNADGKADIAAVHDNGTLYTYANNGKNGFDSSAAAGGGWNTTRLIVGGDFNGDGKADLLALRGASTFYTYSGNGKGSFAAPVISQP